MKRSLQNFFLKNISYCLAVKHRRPFYNLYCDISKNNESIFSEIKTILKKRDSSHLIYLFFIDKYTKEGFRNYIFKRIDYNQFINYFESCKNSLLDDYNTQRYMFQFINFFHLLGTLRLLKDFKCKNKEINEILLDIIKRDEFHFLIKYSASQIYVCRDLGNRFINKKNSLQEFYNKYLIKEIINGSFFTKFVALYSIFYNTFEMEHKNIKKICGKLIEDSSRIDFNILHEYLPQIHCLLYRSYKDKFAKGFLDDNNEGFKQLYFYNEENVKEIKNLLKIIIKTI